MEKLSFDKHILRKFGITMGIAFFVITLFILAQHKHNTLPTSMISLLFFISAFTTPILLKPIYVFWMKLASILSWINTRLLLFIIFYLLFTPIGLIMKLFRVDLLSRRINKNRESYWQKKEKKDFGCLNYERQF